MYLNWKLISFWMEVIAWLTVVAGVIAFFVLLGKSTLLGFETLVAGAVGFVFWKGLSIVTKAAETYLASIYLEDSECALEE